MVINYNPKRKSNIPIRNIDNIMDGLERNGRHQYETKSAPNTNRFLAHKFKSFRDRDIILIGKDDNRQKNIISIRPTHKLIRTGRTKVKILKKDW